jgi:hypothetical protein
MATSGSYDFSLNRNEIITEALSFIGAIAIGETPTDAEMSDGSRTLNMMIKAWQAEGVGLWLNQEVTLFLEYGETSYTLGPTGDHCSAATVKTEIKTAASSGDSTIEADSITGISDGDNIGVELDDNTLQWTTVSGAPSGNTITLAAAITADVAVDNHVYAYTTKIQRPLEIIEARRVDADDNETPIDLISRDEYMSLSDKGSKGTPNQVYYHPQLTNGVLYVWQACDDVRDRIKMTIKRPVQDFDAGTNDCDFPQEWFEALTFNLARRLAVKYGKVFPKDLLVLAIESKDVVWGFDREQTSIYFQPDIGSYR